MRFRRLEDLLRDVRHAFRSLRRAPGFALVALFGHRDLEVRNEALSAVDAMAVTGSKEAVAKIDELEAAEGGRSIWNNFKREALPARSRLQLRKGS